MRLRGVCVSQIAPPWCLALQLPCIYFESRTACRRVQRNVEVVAESGEIDSPFSILGCVTNVWLLYNLRATRITVYIYTYAARDVHVTFIVDETYAWHRRVTYYVREIYQRHSHGRWTAWYDCRRWPLIISGQRPRKIYANGIIYLYVN